MSYFRQIVKRPPPVYNHLNSMDSVRGHGLYSYTPSLAMSIGGIIGFCTVTGYLVFQYLRTRCWLVFALIIGALSKCTCLNRSSTMTNHFASGNVRLYRPSPLRHQRGKCGNVPSSIPGDHVSLQLQKFQHFETVQLSIPT
jgi:hypothetical protein